MAMVTVRIADDIKREMDKLRKVNWSEVMRRAILEEIRREKKRKASQTIDELRAKSKVRWDSVSVIRAWREKRK